MSVAQNRRSVTEDQIERYLKVAETLESEKSFLERCISWNCVNRYVYSRTIDSMEESVKIIRELVALLERKEGVIHK